jgi:4-amino-4-deoxy-L-arabinose transferase-like glycosyltransferase
VRSLFINKTNYTTILIIIAIFFVGFFLRQYNIYEIPRHGATFDEFAWTWLGINLIQNGQPSSWSSQPQYEERTHLIYQGAAFWIVKPYLEHPPFFGLVAGSFAILNGTADMYDVTLEKIRPLALLLGMISIFLVFIIAKSLYGIKVGLLSGAIYATVPTIAIGSRIVQNENFLIPLWLLSLYLLIRYLNTGKKKYRNIAAILAGLLSLAKVPWLVVGLSLSMILFYKKKYRDMLVISGITVSIFSLFLVYGMYFDKELFINLWALQLSRYDISFSGFYSIFSDPLLVDRFYLDGWILFGWLSMVFLLKDVKRNLFVTVPFIAYFVTYVFAIPNEPAHGWYRYPFYPFLIISLSVLLINELKKISFLSIIFVIFVGLLLMHNTWNNAFGFSYTVYRIFIIVFVFPLVIFVLKNLNNKITMLFFGSVIFLFLILNIFSVINYIE